MLYLTRKKGEGIVINDQITITVVDIKRNSIKLGVVFPPEARVLRQEVYQKIQTENQQASLSTLSLLEELCEPKNTSKDTD